MSLHPRWRAAAAVALAAHLSACVLPLGGDRTGRSVSLHPDDLKAGSTTKASLFERLGPPLAIAGPGEFVDEPTPGVQHLQNFGTWLDGGAQAVRQADAWFTLFEERVAIRPTHRVYHWSSTSHPGVFVWLVFLVFRSNWSSTDDLWALVDEETGLVEAVVQRSGG